DRWAQEIVTCEAVEKRREQRKDRKDREAQEPGRDEQQAHQYIAAFELRQPVTFHHRNRHDLPPMPDGAAHSPTIDPRLTGQGERHNRPWVTLSRLTYHMGLSKFRSKRLHRLGCETGVSVLFF